MLKIGLTGGIGAGKTTVATLFNALGIPVYNSDDRAKWLMNQDAELQKQLIKEFGNGVFTNDNLNTPFLASIVFKDSNKLQALNQIVHPKVAVDFLNWVQEQKAPYVIKEAAILVDSGAYKEMDKIILVTADVNSRIDRIVKRDHVSDAAVSQRMKNQMTDDQIKKHAHYLIENNSSLESLTDQVKTIHLNLLEN